MYIFITCEHPPPPLRKIGKRGGGGGEGADVHRLIYFMPLIGPQKFNRRPGIY